MSERLKMLVLRIAVDVMPTTARLARVFEVGDQTCFLCSGGRESTYRIFVDCKVINGIWFQSQWGLRVKELGCVDTLEWINLKVNVDTAFKDGMAAVGWVET